MEILIFVGIVAAGLALSKKGETSTRTEAPAATQPAPQPAPKPKTLEETIAENKAADLAKVGADLVKTGSTVLRGGKFAKDVGLLAFAGGVGVVSGGAIVLAGWAVMAVFAAVFAALTYPVMQWRQAYAYFSRPDAQGWAWRFARDFAEGLARRIRPGWNVAEYRDTIFDANVQNGLTIMGILRVSTPRTVPTNLELVATREWRQWVARLDVDSLLDADEARVIAACELSARSGAINGAQVYYEAASNLPAGQWAIVVAPDAPNPLGGGLNVAPLDGEWNKAAFAVGIQAAWNQAASWAYGVGGEHLLANRDLSAVASELAQRLAARGEPAQAVGSKVIVRGFEIQVPGTSPRG